MVLLPEQGDLASTSFPALLLDLHRASFSGWVRLERDTVSKSFLFREGIPMYAESNLTSESLGIQLMDQGEISRSDYSRVVDRVTSEKCKEGQALLDLDLIEPHGLFVALKNQVRKRILECFGWSKGTFRVEPGDPAPDAAQPFRADLYALLQDGIATHWTSERILGDISARMGRIARRTALIPRIESHLDSDAATTAFIDALDGTRTLWQAVQKASTSRALAAAWLFDAIGAIAYSEDADAIKASDAQPETELEIYFSDLIEETERAEARSARNSRSETDLERARESGTPTAAAPPKQPAKPRRAGPSAALEARIADLHARLEDLDHYEVLGVSPHSDAAEFKRAYLAAAKDYHPDALARLEIDAALRNQANQVFAAIGRAYSVLSNAARRREYDAARETDGLGLDADRIATAETLYRKGEILLRQGNFRGALEFLRPAVEIYPDEAEYQAALGWALYKKPPSEPEAAREHLEAALQLAPDDATTQFRLSVVLRALGENDRSEQLAGKAKRVESKRP
jgi:curved DNA-binding protein CbpA